MAPVNGTNGASSTPEYMAAKPKERNANTLTSILTQGHPTKIDATFEALKKVTWQQVASMFFVKVLWRCYPLLKLVGFLIEWTINFFVLNNGPFGLLYRLVFFKWGDIIIPNQDADVYLSCVGQLDPRTSFKYLDTSKAGKASSTVANALVFPDENVGSRSTGDVCVMAAKISYENKAVVKKVVEKDWGMHFVGFYNCWNEYQKMGNTQVFVCMDKQKDANAVVVAWRGTEAFNAYDWSTDLDFSWVKLDGLGGTHLGFLEALGLGSRDYMDTFRMMKDNAQAKSKRTQTQERQEAEADHVPPSPHHKSKSEIDKTKATSGLSEQIIADPNKMLAFDDITKLVGRLLFENPKAKLFVTGHSLGGALAALYSTLLHYSGETEIASKIAAVYTFGQPRIGDQDFADYASEKLRGRYFRVVYCNDVVPRVPFDNELFSFKHFGNCAYFNSVYDGMVLAEEPNRNFFGLARIITMHLNALWELFFGLILVTMKHGSDFRESTMSILFRLLGLLLPGVAGHSPTNYVNSVRLGPFPLKARLKGDIADLAQELSLVKNNIKDIVYILFSSLPTLPGKDVWNLAAEKFLQAINL